MKYHNRLIRDDDVFLMSFWLCDCLTFLTVYTKSKGVKRVNRDDLKNFVKEKKERIYQDPQYTDFSKITFFLFDPDYKTKNPTAFIYHFGQTGAQLHPVKLAKSFAAYNKHDILCKMQTIATQMQYIIVPVRLLHWRQRFEKTYPHFQVAEYSYLMLPPDILNEKERRTYIDHIIRGLDWNRHLP